MKVLSQLGCAILLFGLTGAQAFAQANPVLGKTLTCGAVRAVFAQSGEVTLTTADKKTQKGTLKVVANPTSKNIRDLQVLDARGQFLIHFQQMAGNRYELEGDGCQVK